MQESFRRSCCCCCCCGCISLPLNAAVTPACLQQDKQDGKEGEEEGPAPLGKASSLQGVVCLSAICSMEMSLDKTALFCRTSWVSSLAPERALGGQVPGKASQAWCYRPLCLQLSGQEEDALGDGEACLCRTLELGQARRPAAASLLRALHSTGACLIGRWPL